MNSSIKNVLIFAAGAVVGAAGSYQYCKTYFERLAQEEIDDVIAKFSHKTEESAKKDAKTDSKPAPKKKEKMDKAKVKEQRKKDLKTQKEILETAGYVDYGNSFASPVPKKDDDEQSAEEILDNIIEEDIPYDTEHPYVISPEEFGELYGYAEISLYYFADGVVTDEDENPVEDVADIIGFECLGTFGQYEDDAVHVRNDRLRSDYEILLDHRKYSDVIQKKPRRLED